MSKQLLLALLAIPFLANPAFSDDRVPVGRVPLGPAPAFPEVRRLPPADAVAAPDEFFPRPPITEDLQLAELPAKGGTAEKKKKAKDPWGGSFELGLDGASGNNETLNFRCGFNGKLESELQRLKVDIDYRKNSADFIETANRAHFDSRWEYLYPESRWTTFLHNTLEYDEFQSFDLRVTGDLGVGYRLIDNEFTTFSARFGSGFSREFGGPDERYVPEAVFGLDFEHELNKRNKITLSSEYTPDWTGWKDFRLKSRAAWEALVNEEMNLSLKLSVMDRLDSTPNGAKANDLDYSIVLLWKF